MPAAIEELPGFLTLQVVLRRAIPEIFFGNRWGGLDALVLRTRAGLMDEAAHVEAEISHGQDHGRNEMVPGVKLEDPVFWTAQDITKMTRGGQQIE